MDVIDTLRTFCALSAMFLIARLISSDMVFISVADAADSSMLAASCCVVAEMPSISPLISSTFFPDGGHMAAQGLCIVLHAPKMSRKALPDLAESCRKVSDAVFPV